MDDTAAGIAVIYGGYLRSSTGALGDILLEAVYCDRTAAHEKPSPAGKLVRTLGSDVTIKEATGVLAREIIASQKNAASKAKFALKYVYSGGAPGLGK